MPSKKRLNVNFVAIVSAPLVLLVILFVFHRQITDRFPRLKWWIRGTPAEHADRARALFDAGKYDEACEAYKRAIQLKGAADAPLLTAVGDSYSHMVVADEENFRLMAGFWNQALQIDPNFMPALQRMLTYWEGIGEVNSGAEAAKAWDEVQTVAAKILSLEPTDHHARVAEQRGLIMRWGAGAETSPQRIEEACATLLKIAEETPFDSDTIWYAMQARMNLAGNRLKANDRAEASRIFAGVYTTVDDAIKAHPDDAMIHFRGAILLSLLGRIERAGTANQTPKYVERIREELEKAAALVKPSDDKYIEIKLASASILLEQKNTDGAIEVYRGLLKDRPGDARVRLSFAEVLSRSDAKGRAEAIDLLEHIPPPDPKQVVGIKALQSRAIQVSAQLALTDALLDTWAVTSDPAAKDATLKKAEAAFAAATANPGTRNRPRTLVTRGRLELIKGQPLQAVQTLESARGMTSENDAASADLRLQIEGTLAGAYLVTNQTGQARLLLTDIVARRPSNNPARMMLARLLLSEGNNREALQHLDILAANLPDSTEIARLQVLALDKDKDAARINELYARLPEKTREEMIIKSQVADRVGKRDESVRLLEAVRAAYPNDVNAIADLARLYVDMRETEKAIAVVEDAIAKNPDRSELKLLQAEVAGSDMGEIRRDLIDKINDPLRKELLLYQVSVQEKQYDEAIQHLKAAAAIKPDDRRVLDLQFQNAVLNRQWDAAAGYVEQLAKMNADMADGLLYRVRLATAKLSLNEAADLAQQLTKKLPQFSQSWVALGQVQRAQGKPQEAVQSFELALKNQPNHLEALRQIIGASYELNQPAMARRYIDQGRKLFPKYQPLREMELAHEVKYGDPEKVIGPRKEMLKQAAESKDTIAEQRAWQALGDAYLAVARSKPTPKDAAPFLEQARDTYKQAMAKWPDDLKLVQNYSEASVQLKANADAEKAIRDLMARPAWQGKPDPTLMLADFLARTGKSADQEKVLRDYLVANATAVPVQIRLSAMLAQQNKLDEALKILEPNQDVPLIRRQRIELQIAGNRLKEAENEIQNALATTPNPGPLLLNRQAFVYMKSGRATQALQVLERVLSEYPNDAEALFYRASVYIGARRNLEQAIRDLLAVRDTPGTELNGRVLLSQAYHYFGDDESAIRELEDAIRLFPADKSLRLRVLDLYAHSDPPRWAMAEKTLREARNQPQLASDVELIRAEADMWYQRRDSAKATEAILLAMKIAPSDTNLFRTYCSILLQAKDFRRLMAVTDAAIKSTKNPQWWIYDFRGRATKGMGNTSDAALAEFGKGIDAAQAEKDDAAVAAIMNSIVKEISVAAAKLRVMPLADKGDNRWRLILARLLESENDITGAIEWIERVINDPKVDPVMLDLAHQSAATLYLRKSPPDCDRAIGIYKKMLNKDPNDIIALNNIACTMILANSGHTPKEALEYSARAFKLVGQSTEVNPYIYDTQGYVLVLNGQAQEGISLLQQAVDKEPIPEACYHLGEAYLALATPRYSDAQDSLKQAMGALDALSKDNKPLDADLKVKIEAAMERARPPATQNSSGA